MALLTPAFGSLLSKVVREASKLVPSSALYTLQNVLEVSPCRLVSGSDTRLAVFYQTNARLVGVIKHLSLAGDKRLNKKN